MQLLVYVSSKITSLMALFRIFTVASGGKFIKISFACRKQVGVRKAKHGIIT
jgi:hypothetical protein